MPTEIEEYLSHLRQEVLSRTGESGNVGFREECFLEYILELLEDHNEVNHADLLRPPYQANSAGRLPAAKVNGWSLSGDGVTLDLYIVHYADGLQLQELGLPETRRQFALARGFLRRAIEGHYTKLEESTDAFVAAKAIFESRELLSTIRLFFITDCAVRSLQIEEESLPGYSVRYVIWDVEKLSRLKVGEQQLIELDFVNDYGGSIPCLQQVAYGGEYQTFLMFMRASVLAKMYGDHGQRLLERNVRAFLQTRGAVNRGLQKTLKEEPHRFLAYNNGLCCTATEVKFEAKKGQLLLEGAKDFQIVNGAQTTASIFHADKKGILDADQVTVQVKLTVACEPEKVLEFVPLISRYANSQNKVNTADFSANGLFHRALERFSRTVWAPPTSGLERGTHWYYERARGSYLDDKARLASPKARRDWETQNPNKQKFTKTDVAKFEHAWLGMPHLVCFGAEKNFNWFAEKLDQHEEASVDLQYFRRLIAKAILFRSAEVLFNSLGLSGLRSQSVAYSVAWMAVQSDWRINLDQVWEKQSISKTMEEVVKATCKEAHQHILGQTGNPAEAAKKENCWNTFKNRNISITNKWKEEFATIRYLSLLVDDANQDG